jgi:hypothetical protein
MQVAIATASVAARPAPKDPDLVDRVKRTHTSMSIAEFMMLEDHPRQRDTARHAEMAKKKHLAQPSPTHAVVHVASYMGRQYKLDGHTRAFLWGKGELKAPKNVAAHIYMVDTFADLLELYTHFDNASAVETTADKLSGAARQAAVEFKSSHLRRYKFAAALRMASRLLGPEVADIYRNLETFRDELVALDELDPNARLFPVGVIAGAVIILRKDKADALKFLGAYNANAGQKTSTHCDGVQALHDLITRTVRGKSGNSRTLELMNKTVATFERYRKGGLYLNNKVGPKVQGVDLSGYLA